MATLLRGFANLHLQNGASHAHAVNLNDRSQGEKYIKSWQRVSGRFLITLFRIPYPNYTKAPTVAASNLLPFTMHRVRPATASSEDASRASRPRSHVPQSNRA